MYDIQLQARRLKELRGDRSQKTVAKGIGVTTSAYAMYERGERSPRDSIKLQIAEYFDCSVGYIFFDEPDTKRGQNTKRRRRKR